MSDSFVGRRSLPDLGLWDKLKERRRPISFDLEITARCNNDCRHCYINLPATTRRLSNLDCHPIRQAQTRRLSRSRRAPTAA